MHKLSKLSSILVICLIYIISFVLTWTLFSLLPVNNNLLKILAADVLSTIFVFLFSLILNNSSVYDPYWSIAPPVIAVYLFLQNPAGNRLRQYLVLILVFFWGIRLTMNWARGWNGLKHQDWRYSDLQKQTGRFYWPVSFLGIHLMPTLLVYLGCLPLFYILADPSPWGTTEWMAFFVAGAAILIEWISDEQLRAFRKTNPRDAVMKSGLWSLMRHPNYFGEISFWFGLYLFVLTGNSVHSAWTGVGFLSMIFLFSLVSVPLMDRHNLAVRPDYADRMKTVRALMPLWKK